MTATAPRKPMRLDPASLNAIPPRLRAAVEDIAARVRAAGGRALMVGGAVRDLLLGESPVKDVDLEVFGLAPERLRQTLESAYRLDCVGMAFGVLKIAHLDIDVALPRLESKTAPGHKGFDVSARPDLTIAQAAHRRDFTVNAIYCDPLDGALEDPCGGIADLRARRLRRVSEKFAEDPLRVLRGMQFAARFNLEPDADTIAACAAMSPEGLPRERQFEEWSKLILKGKSISRGLEFLRATGWVRHYPELAALIGCQQDPKWHPEGDVWAHTLRCLDAFALARDRELARGGDRASELVVGLAVLAHDFGKPLSSRVEDGRIRSKGHDALGADCAAAFLRRLTNEERLLREVPPLVAAHMQPYALYAANAGDAAVRRLAVRAGRIDRIVRVCEADSAGCGLGQVRAAAPTPETRWLLAAAERLAVAAAAPKPILLGRHLIEMGYRPSAQFGQMLKRCYEAQLDGAFSDLDGALAWFRAANSQPPA